MRRAGGARGEAQRWGGGGAAGGRRRPRALRPCRPALPACGPTLANVLAEALCAVQAASKLHSQITVDQSPPSASHVVLQQHDEQERDQHIQSLNVNAHAVVKSNTDDASIERGRQPGFEEATTKVLPTLCCDVKLCSNAAEKRVRGIEWDSTRFVRRKGDHLCMECYAHFKDALEEYIPMPPRTPGGMLIIRSKRLKTVDKSTAISIAWCKGNLCQAMRILASSRPRYRTTDL